MADEVVDHRSVERMIKGLGGDFYEVAGQRVFARLSNDSGRVTTGCVVIPMTRGLYPEGMDEGGAFTESVQKWKLGLTRMVEFHPLHGILPTEVHEKIMSARRELEAFNG